jgi:hypothetical protein
MVLFDFLCKSINHQQYLKEGAIKDDAALWRTLTPINRTKDALSCSKTNFTVVPAKINAFNNKNVIPQNTKCIKPKWILVPFNEAIRSDTNVLETTRKATANRCAPCLSSIDGTWNIGNKKICKKWRGWEKNRGQILKFLWNTLDPLQVIEK